MIRRALVAALAVLALACDPDIGAGTYFCGPELFCPPSLVCDPGTYTCELPSSVQPFACPEGTQDQEPDDSIEQASDLARLDCNYNVEPLARCIASAADVDYVTFSIDECYGSDPHLNLQIRFPVAVAPLELDVLDEDGAVIGSGETCTPSEDFTGMEWVCLLLPPTPGTYVLRVRATGEANCSGDCAFNQYLLYIGYPLA